MAEVAEAVAAVPAVTAAPRTPRTPKARAVDLEETLNITKQLKSGVEQLTVKQQAAATKIKGDSVCRNQLRHELECAVAALEEYKKGYHILRNALKKAKANIDIGNSQREKQRAKSMSVFARMAAGDAATLVCMCFQAWQKECSLEKEKAFFEAGEKRQAQLQKAKEERLKQDARKFLERMVASNKASLLSCCFAGWIRAVMDERELKGAEERLKKSDERLKAFIAKKSAGAMSVLDRLSSASAMGICNMAFDYWAEFLADEKRERQTQGTLRSMEERLRAELEKRRAGQVAVLMRSIAQGAQAMVHQAFSDWCAWTMDAKREQELIAENAAKLNQLSETKRMQAMNVIARMAGNQSTILVEACYESWARHTTDEAKERQQMSEHREQMAKLVEHNRMKAIKFVERLAGERGTFLLESFYELWAAHYREEKKDRQMMARRRSDLDELQMKKRESALQVVSRMSGGQEWILLESCVMGWSQFVNDDKEVKAEKDFRARVDIEIMDLKAKTEDKDCELDDLYQELEASRNKTVLMRGQMSQFEALLLEYSNILDDSLRYD